MARGDLETKTFNLKTKSGQVFSTEPDEIYMTVKKASRDHDYLFQKKMSDGSIVKVETGKYHFTILPEDTDNLDFRDYVFDIEIVKDGMIKKTFCGKLVIGPEVTHHYNEGGS